CRSTLGISSGLTPAQIFALIETWLLARHSIEVAFVSAAFLRGSRGELVLEEGMLYLDKRLQYSLEEKLEVVAHEVGHLVLHHRQLSPGAIDLLRGSVFLDQGVPALARYSPRSKEE